MWVTDGDEKCVLKLYVYKTPFGKSGHIFQICFIITICLWDFNEIFNITGQYS